MVHKVSREREQCWVFAKMVTEMTQARHNVRNTAGAKTEVKPVPGAELDNDKGALYSHPAAIGHFCQLNRAVKPSCQAGQYCHWMGTMT